MEDMAAEGLRTLMFAYKQLDANCDIKQGEVDALESEIEMLGVTGLHDLL
jgi:magnesium-transporting ATPase (P-type)